MFGSVHIPELARALSTAKTAFAARPHYQALPDTSRAVSIQNASFSEKYDMLSSPLHLKW
jgi:hypothetical protein